MRVILFFAEIFCILKRSFPPFTIDFGFSGESVQITSNEAERLLRTVGTTCPLCSRSFYNRSNLRKHIRHSHVVSKERYICEVCLKSFKYRETLQKHKLCHHPSEVQNVFKCALCKSEYKVRWKYLQHVRNFHGVTSF
ncbi:Uncharacterised protein at_DN0092 [Pycnogonum litorale]